MADLIHIEGGIPLEGEVRVSGAKNAALPLLISSLLTADKCIFSNVPELEDISVTLKLLSNLGAQVYWNKNKVSIQAASINRTEAPYGLVRSLRASFWVLGPLLSRIGEARVSLPGGDAIGSRPVDLHLLGLEKMGAQIELAHGVVAAKAEGGLRGAKIDLGFPSVGATHQILMAAALVPEETVIENAAAEPEVSALGEHLISMGAEIEGLGGSTLKISGRTSLSGALTRVLGDRIEAATYLGAAALTGGKVVLKGIDPRMLQSTVEVFQSAGCEVEAGEDWISLRSLGRLKSVDMETAPFPGLATDVQPLLMAAMCAADGESKVSEKIFESRFGHVAEFRRFGAKISVEGDTALVEGQDRLSGAPVEAGDIRAAAALVLLGLVAEGKTVIDGVYHLDRGYDGLCEKLVRLGARIERVAETESEELVLGC